MRLFGLKAVFQSLTTKLKIWSPLYKHRDGYMDVITSRCRCSSWSTRLEMAREPVEATSFGVVAVPSLITCNPNLSPHGR